MDVRARGTLRSEDGFGLIEVIVSAAVLMVVVLGTLAALDSITRTAGANQARTVAATLAEKDLERLRSLRTSDLNRLEAIDPETTTVTVGNVKYEITSKAQWVTDATGEDISCALAADKGSYLRITSSVIPTDASGATRPVTLSSIVAPQPGKGTLTALVKKANGDPAVCRPVEAVGPTPATETTNDAGCAVFDESEAGSYTLKLNSTGWVDPDGNQLVEKPGTVSAGNLTTVEFLYDRAGSFPVTVVTRRPGAGSDIQDRSSGVFAAHTGVSAGYRAITTSTSTGTFDGMFPFETPYEVYSGGCTGNNPAEYIPDYFSTHPLAVAQVEPATVGLARTVLEPAIDVTVTHKNGSGPVLPVIGARVYAYPKTPDCDGTRIRLGDTDATGKVPAYPLNLDAGPGLPFGQYDICVRYNNGSRLLRMYWSSVGVAPEKVGSTVANTNPLGTPLTAPLLSTGANTTGCGANTPIS
jgi:Tfp pilus assembly protein PilV